MRVRLRRALVVCALTLAAADSPPIAAQQRAATVIVQPEIRTRIEALLATPSVPLTADYYRIDMRFGPNLRLDAVIVGGLDDATRLRGVRVQVRDDENRNRQEGTSYLDMEEVMSLTRALTPMADAASKWTGRDERRSMEISFTSAGGFRLAIREFGRAQRAYLSTGALDPVVTSIEVTEIITLKHAFDQALVVLSTK